MGIETVNGIWDLNELWPLSSDTADGSDNHHRVIKEAIEETFPYISANISTTSESFNFLKGVSSNIQAQLDDVSASVVQMIADYAANEASLADQAASIAANTIDIQTLNSKADNIYKTYLGLVSAGGTATYLPGGFTVALIQVTGEMIITHNLGALDRSDLVLMATPAEPGYTVGVGASVGSFIVRCRTYPGNVPEHCDYYFQLTIR